MTRRSVTLAPALLLALVVASDPLQAQVPRTGATTVSCPSSSALCDANWSVRWFGISGSTGGGFAPNAFIIPNIPSVWAPNTANVQQWIGAATSGSVGTGATRYYLQTAFTQAVAGTVSFGLGWDNSLVGAYVGGSIDLGTGLFVGGTSLLPGVAPGSPFTLNGKTAGFCRDSDGVFPGNQYPDCVLNVALGVNASQQNILTFVIEGDGTTDGFLLGGATGSNTPTVIQVPPVTSVPEPSTYALLASGLAAIGFARSRRRA